MDIYCPRCAEPLEVDELHEQDVPYAEARDLFFTQGCGVLLNRTPCTKVDSVMTDASSAFADIYGDDVDGIALMMEDLHYLGQLD